MRITKEQLIEELQKLPDGCDIEFRAKITSSYGSDKTALVKFQGITWSATPIIELEN